MRDLFKVGALLAISIGFASCKPVIEADFYVGDILEVASTESALIIPIRMSLPIMTADDCEEDKAKMLPALAEHGLNVRFISCEELSGEMHDILKVEMDTEIVFASDLSNITINGLFGIVIAELNPGIVQVYFLKTDRADRAVSQIDRNYSFQSVKLDDIELSIRINNDLRADATVEVDSSFVNNSPVDQPRKFTLARRDTISVKPSDVRSAALLSSGQIAFMRVIKN